MNDLEKASDQAVRPVLSVIVVSFNTRDMTLHCLRDLFADLSEIDAEVLVADNASKDGSAEAIEAAFPAVRLLRNQENVGFGAANNQAIAIARGKYLLMLNTDAFVRLGCCAALVKILEENATVGVVGARLYNEDGSQQISCYPFPTPFRAWIENLWISTLWSRHPKLGDFRKWKHDEIRDVDWVVGACLVCRREVIEKVGGFDPQFFMYSEETDWQQRIRRAGWKVLFTPEAEAVHLGGASGTREPETINRHFFTSFDRYQLKHHGRKGFLLVRAAMITGSLLRLPAWSAAWLLRPARRPKAQKKIQHYLWLLRRQMFSPMSQG